LSRVEGVSRRFLCCAALLLPNPESFLKVSQTAIGITY